MKEHQINHWNQRRIALCAASVLLAQIAIGAALTWGTWPDVLIDFGREWYVPQRLASGAVLYRDLAYFNGPLSPTLNACLMRLSGSTLQTLVWANLVVLVLFVLSLYALLSRIASRPAALLGTSLVIWLCAFSQYLYVGNYNWVCPYSHEMTHGLLLSVAALLSADRFSRSGSLIWLAITGILCGMIFLTKCEIALAAYAGTMILLLGRVLKGQLSPSPPDSHDWEGEAPAEPLSVIDSPARTVRQEPHPPGKLSGQRWIACVAVFAVAFVAPVGIALLVLMRDMPLPVVWEGISGSWKYLLQRNLTGSEFYRTVMGTSSITESLWLLYGWTVVYAVALGSTVWIGKGITCRKRERMRALAALGVLLVGFLLLRDRLDWLSMARPWSLILAWLAVLFAVRWWKQDQQSETTAPELLRLGVVVWAGALLLKIVLFCRVFHYGFSLAAPALAVVVCAGWDWWPTWWKRHGISPLIARSGVLSLIIAATAAHVLLAVEWGQKHRVVVGTGANQFIADERGKNVNQLLEEIAKQVPPNASLACLPEGATINSLSGRRTSLKYLNFVPADMAIFGEQYMLEDLRTSPPDWLALINRDTSEYGPTVFTIDYGQTFGKWIETHYEVRIKTGGPFMTAKPGFTLLQRRENPTP